MPKCPQRACCTIDRCMSHRSHGFPRKVSGEPCRHPGAGATRGGLAAGEEPRAGKGKAKRAGEPGRSG